MATTRGVAHHPGRESTLLRQARRAPRHRARTEDRVAEDVGGREKGAPEGPYTLRGVVEANADHGSIVDALAASGGETGFVVPARPERRTLAELYSIGIDVLTYEWIGHEPEIPFPRLRRLMH